MPSIQDSACVQQTLDFFREPERPARKSARRGEPKRQTEKPATLRPEPAFAIAADHLARCVKRSLPPCALPSIRIEEIRKAVAAKSSSESSRA